MGGMWWFILSALTIIPMVKLLPFFGINKYWSVACIVPLGTVALLWWIGVKLTELERK